MKTIIGVGPFRVAKDIADVKSVDELRLQKGSARYKLMKYALKNRDRVFTRDELVKVAGGQALRGMRRYQFLTLAK